MRGERIKIKGVPVGLVGRGGNIISRGKLAGALKGKGRQKKNEDKERCPKGPTIVMCKSRLKRPQAP